MAGAVCAFLAVPGARAGRSLDDPVQWRLARLEGIERRDAMKALHGSLPFPALPALHFFTKTRAGIALRLGHLSGDHDKIVARRKCLRIHKRLIFLTRISRDDENRKIGARGTHKRTDPAIVEVCKHFVEACKPTLERYFAKEQLNNARLDLEGWANINPPHGYNQMHTHDTFDLSGVYFVKIPQTSSEASGALQFLNPSYRYGPYSKLFHAMNPPKFTFRPKEGTLLVFPATMPHWVLPNDEDEDRITLAFNLRMKELSGG